MHRKVHLFDIDIPGGITFKESETLTGGDWQTIVETGASSLSLVGAQRPTCRADLSARLAASRGASELTLKPACPDFGKIGVGICYDVRFPELAMIAARKGAFALFSLSDPSLPSRSR